MKVLIAAAVMVAAGTESPSRDEKLYIYCQNGIQHTTDSLYRPTFDQPTRIGSDPVKCMNNGIYKIHRDPDTGEEQFTRIK